MYVSAHGCVADAVLEMPCFYKPGFVLVLLFKENLGKRGRCYIFFLTSTPSGWGRGLFSTPDPRSINLHLQQYPRRFILEDCVYVRWWDILCRTSLRNALGNAGLQVFFSVG